jgi:hypothetical protein
VNADVKKLAWSDPRMGDVTRRILEAWRRDGGEGPFMWFNFCTPGGKWGRWGLLENINQTDSPRYQAAAAYAEEVRRGIGGDSRDARLDDAGR